MRTVKLRFISDPGHGWLEVPHALYLESGFKASKYSYSGDWHVFLEEDCDAPAFVDMLKAKGILVEHTFVELDQLAYIRQFDRIGAQ